MQITAIVNQPLTATANQLTKAGESLAVIQPFSTDSLEKNGNPAQTAAALDRVTLGQNTDVPSSYDMAPVYISGLRDTKPAGPAAAALSQNLLRSLNTLAANKAPLDVSSVFGQIGSLSRETVEYRNEARRMQVTQESAIKSSTPNFTLQPNAENKSVKLSIKTKDGDTIYIELNNKSIGVNNSTLEFSFKVTGSLSEAEQKALGELTDKLGQMGDEFFRTDTTELRNLKGIDTSVISHFSFTLRRPERDSFVEQSYEFTVDERAQTQTLRASDVRGYSVDITTALTASVPGSLAEPDVLDPYLELVREAADDTAMENKSRRFLLDAFETLFEQFIHRSAPSDTLQPTETNLAAFDTGLPDFTATISSSVKHHPENYRQAEVLKLTLRQETRVETSADTVLVKQESRFELTNNRFKGMFDAGDGDVSNPYYTYITEHREGNVSRLLSMTNDKLNNLLVEQNINSEKTVSDFENYKLVDKETNAYEDRKVTQFSELIATLNNDKRFDAIHKLLNDSKAIPFLDR